MTEFSIELQVRDYECDMQGIVNNAIYQHYLEHARHKFLEQRGLSFAELTLAGTIIVVARAELDYLSSLRAGEDFIVTVRAERPSKVRLVFHQEIRRVADDSAVLRAVITATAVNERGRPYFPAELEKLL
ncbi:acyl-CoA thioesterase [Spongiibacter tropicus]|jgi:acyl-CoA thioester hydrolase|uniref:acyl-CoA thioesterase n=1 Tax=Spongiibacter tropicus TaxID=454602 RepID=UPI0024E1D177|nr:acyl-CoA thioesterase [Spongiibacter tropicus]